MYSFDPAISDNHSEAVKERLQDPEITQFIQDIYSYSKSYFNTEPFDQKSIGKLLSLSAEKYKKPEKFLKVFE